MTETPGQTRDEQVERLYRYQIENGVSEALARQLAGGTVDVNAIVSVTRHGSREQRREMLTTVSQWDEVRLYKALIAGAYTLVGGIEHTAAQDREIASLRQQVADLEAGR